VCSVLNNEQHICPGRSGPNPRCAPAAWCYGVKGWGWNSPAACCRHNASHRFCVALSFIGQCSSIQRDDLSDDDLLDDYGGSGNSPDRGRKRKRLCRVRGCGKLDKGRGFCKAVSVIGGSCDMPVALYVSRRSGSWTKACPVVELQPTLLWRGRRHAAFSSIPSRPKRTLPPPPPNLVPSHALHRPTARRGQALHHGWLLQECQGVVRPLHHARRGPPLRARVMPEERTHGRRLLQGGEHVVVRPVVVVGRASCKAHIGATPTALSRAVSRPCPTLAWPDEGRFFFAHPLIVL
jgi:hypothetical protein